MKRTLLVGLTIAYVGCTFQTNPTRRYRYFMEPGYTETEQAQIVDAFLRWQSKTDGYLTFEPSSVDAGEHLIRLRKVTKGELHGDVQSWGMSGTAIGRTTQWDESIETLDTMKPAGFEATVMHEIGHAIGLDHDVPGTVMCWSLGCNAGTVTCRDVQQLCKAWKDVGGCDADRMSACKDDPPAPHDDDPSPVLQPSSEDVCPWSAAQTCVQEGSWTCVDPGLSYAGYGWQCTYVNRELVWVPVSGPPQPGTCSSFCF